MTEVDQLKNIVEKWVFFFKHANETSEGDAERMKGSDLIIKRAHDELNMFDWSEKESMAYEQEVKYAKDAEAILQHELDSAKERGIEIGDKRGKEEPKLRWQKIDSSPAFQLISYQKP